MAKKFGKLMVLATIAGAAAAGISYLTKYRSFNKELDEDFPEFEDEDATEVPDSTMSRNYVSLHADKDEFLVAAGDMMNAAKDAASAAKNMVKDAAAIVADNTREAVSVARDGAQKAGSAAEDAAEKAETVVEDVVEKTESAVEDAVIKTEDAVENITETVEDAMAETAEKLEDAADKAEDITPEDTPVTDTSAEDVAEEEKQVNNGQASAKEPAATTVSDDTEA